MIWPDGPCTHVATGLVFIWVAWQVKGVLSLGQAGDLQQSMLLGGYGVTLAEILLILKSVCDHTGRVPVFLASAGLFSDITACAEETVSRLMWRWVP